MTILVATDFSEASQPALAAAKQMARRLNESITIIHILESMASIGFGDPRWVVGFDPELADKVEDQRRTNAEYLLNALVAECQAQTVAARSRLIESSSIWRSLMENASELNATLIVLGTHGHRGLRRLAFGSVAEATIVHADRPVLAVPSSFDTSASALADAAKPLRLTVAVDRSNSSAAAVEWTTSLRRATKCEATYLHLFSPPSELDRYGLAGRRATDATDAETISLLEREFRQTLGSALEDAALKIVPTWGSVSEHLMSQVRLLGADIVVLGTRQNRGFKRMWRGSTVHEALQSLGVPLLCVPARLKSTQTAVPSIHRVLVATDLSDLASQSVPHAYGLVGGGGGVVHICYVKEHALPTYASATSAHDAMTVAEKQVIEAAILQMVPEQARTLGVTTTVEVIEGGGAAEAICRTANRLGVDAICIGSHGRTGLASALLGSVAQNVIAHAEQPVYVVRSRRSN